MKITKQQLKQIIEEEVANLDEEEAEVVLEPEYDFPAGHEGPRTEADWPSSRAEDYEAELENVIYRMLEAGVSREDIDDLITTIQQEYVKHPEELEETSEKGYKKAEKAMRKTAKKKFPKDKERQDKYVYGGKRKMGWKPEREK